ncbi:hypothetical protein FQR65_LT08688 [Abscondita terminalis]|nr:hypothetical protein FQR65_LT08688 [Abscondita terminalis]
MVHGKLVCFILIVIASACNSARILGIIPIPSYSHQEVFFPIWRELSLRGHQVTTITTNPLKDPKLTNLTEIDISFLYTLHGEHLDKFIHSNFVHSILAIVTGYEKACDYTLSHSQVQSLINDENEKFDVVMIEYGVVAMTTFAKRFKAPLIVVSSMDAFSDLLISMGNPTHPVLYPDMILPTEENRSLLDRMVLILYKIFSEYIKYYIIIPGHQKVSDKYFGTQYSPVDNFEISLALINSDTTFHKVKPLIPTIVQIGGGTHRTALKPLPKELKKTLDASEHGFIYFSLGSNVKNKDLPEKTVNVILETFAELPYTVLWKFELDEMPNKPKNVITSKWFPQQDIFKHPKIKLFITQGGLQSMDEAIYDNIPMLGLPFMGDQHFNMDKMVNRGIGLSLDYKTLRKDEFKANILELINNPKYRNKMKELAELSLDQPMTGLEKAIWWTEYVIRHNGTRHLRSPLLDIPFYQYYLLDVIAVIATVLIVLIGTIFFIVRFFIRLIRKLMFTKKVKTN